MKLLFSIIIPTYNRADFLPKTIESVISQTYQKFELIIINDGSTDHTNSVVKTFDDKRIFYFEKSNEERGAARNYGAKVANGDFLYFLDSDDLLYNNHLEVANDFINSNQPSLFFQQYEIIKTDGVIRSVYRPTEKIINDLLVLKGNFMSCHGVFIKKELFIDNRFNEDRKLAGSEDYELWLRLAARYPIHYSSIITSALVEHDDRSVLSMNKEQLIKRKKLMLDYILRDRVFINKYGKYKSRLQTDAYSYIALHCILSGEKLVGIKYYIKAILTRPFFLLNKRSLAILYRLMRF